MFKMYEVHDVSDSVLKKVFKTWLDATNVYNGAFDPGASDEKQLMLLVNNLSKKNIPSIRVVELIENSDNVASVLDITNYKSNQTLAIKSHIKKIVERGNYVDVYGVDAHGELIFK